MQRILSKELKDHPDEKVRIRGWINTLRSMGKISFLIVRDRAGFAQVVIGDKAEAKRLSALQPGTIVTVEGTCKIAEQAVQGAEIIDPKIIIEVAVKEPPPIEYTKPEIPADLETILDHRSISLRNRKIQAIFKIQAELVHAFRIFMREKVDAVEYFSPNIIGASSEGGAEFFNVDYFGYSATLAQSSQLYKQIMVGVNERVFALMPFFRAEPSHTPRHLSEGKQFEFEMGFFDHWHEVLDVQEGCIKAMIRHLESNSTEELKTLEIGLVKAPRSGPSRESLLKRLRRSILNGQELMTVLSQTSALRQKKSSVNLLAQSMAPISSSSPIGRGQSAHFTLIRVSKIPR